jgi:hypothetical protein
MFAGDLRHGGQDIRRVETLEVTNFQSSSRQTQRNSQSIQER